MKGISLKSLANKLHPPLPKTSRESQQLLNLLTSSFRRHLDNQHPPVNSAQSTVRAAPDAGSAAKPTVTEQHMSSILEHPLFRTVPSTLAPQNVQTRTPQQAQHHDPFGALDNAMASGRADSRALHGCLQTHRSMLRGLSHEESLRTMKDIQGGSRIISWFLGADAESRKLFFENRHTISLAMPYLAAQGLHDTVLEWLDIARTPHHAPCQTQKTNASSFSEFNILYEYVAAEVKYGAGINGAISFFLRACDASWRARARGRPTDAFRPAAHYLARWIAAPENAAEAQRINPLSFESFHSVCLLLPTKVWKAFLPVYHPTNPTFGAAIAYMERYKKTSHDKPDLLLRLSLHVASSCLEQENYRNAAKAIAFAKVLLPEDGTAVTIPAKKEHGERTVTVDDLVASLSIA